MPSTGSNGAGSASAAGGTGTSMATGLAAGPPAVWPMGAGAAWGGEGAAVTRMFPASADLTPPYWFAPVMV
eukprot:12836721-Alexandrium_andersonii.AAC.1